MKHRAAKSFWRLLDKPPQQEQRRARENYELLKHDERHPSLHFKRIGRYCSVRVGLDYRAVGVPDGDVVMWVWIGTHADYDRLIGG